MKTQIFENYEAFLRREDKTINGVSPKFAAEHPEYEKENETNKGCFDCERCSYCYYCSYCSGCSYCYNCSDCSRLKNNNTEKHGEIPKIENIHAAVLAAATSTPDALDMSAWHTCNTTHCRAGWVVHLAGEKGYALEKQTSTLFTAMQIYKASSDIRVSPTRFFESHEQGIADMKRCAELEAGEST